MKFVETKLNGSFIIDPEWLEDDRGFFARSWCDHEAAIYGLSPKWVQCNISFNRQKGTMRGMHYQAAPFEETKLVRCTSGGIFDVIVDLRRGSATFKEWVGAELTAENRRMMYIPEGFAHGFLTLQERSEIFYQMSTFYVPASSRGVRWNDPSFEIHWPIDVSVISERDAHYPDFLEQQSVV